MLRIVTRTLFTFGSFLLAGSLLSAGILTDNLGKSKRGEVSKPKLEDQKIWDEYVLVEAETAKYEGGEKPFTATAWRLKDPTGAQGAFRWLRPVGAKPGNADALNYSKFSVMQGNTLLMAFGNYLIRFDGAVPVLDELKIFLFQLPKVDQSALPPVLDYLPADGLVAGSDRFISGPSSLEKFYPFLPPSAVGFHFGTEGITARYATNSGEMEMAVFYYPTNQMARDRQPEFQKVPGAVVKRAGPLLALVANPKNADDAERLLAKVNYNAQVTINQSSAKEPNAGDMLIAIMQLIGVLLSVTVVGGVMGYAMRRMRRQMAGGGDEEAMTSLHLEDR